MKVYLDANAYDKLLCDLSLLQIVEQKIKKGKLECIILHITEDELEQAPPQKRESLRSIFKIIPNWVPTGVTP